MENEIEQIEEINRGKIIAFLIIYPIIYIRVCMCVCIMFAYLTMYSFSIIGRLHTRAKDKTMSKCYEVMYMYIHVMILR